MAKKKITFSINESGRMIGESFTNIEHGNGEIIFTSENKTRVEANLKSVKRLIAAIQEGHYRIIKRGLNGEVEKEYK